MNELENRSGTVPQLFAYIAIFLPAVLYFIVLDRYALNYPVADDYNAIIQFLCEFRNASFGQKFSLLFSQHNEHRILFSRIVYVLFDWLPGLINMRAIIMVGNLQILVSFLFFLHFIKKALPNTWQLPAFVGSLCFFDLSNWEIGYSPMGSVANYSVIMLFFASMYFYSRQTSRAFFLAVFFHVLTFFSLGNGIVAAGALIAFAIFNRDKRAIITTTIVTLICAAIYFSGYSLMGSASLTLSVSGAALFFLRYMSGHFFFFDMSSVFPVIAGLVICLSAIFLLPLTRNLRVPEGYSFFFALLLFAVGSALLTSIFRSALSPLPSYRYLIYAHFVFAVVTVFLFRKLRGSYSRRFFFTFIYFLILNYLVNVHVGVSNYDSTRRWILSKDVQHPDEEGARREVSRACKLNIYCWPSDHGR